MLYAMVCCYLALQTSLFVLHQNSQITSRELSEVAIHMYLCGQLLLQEESDDTVLTGTSLREGVIDDVHREEIFRAVYIQSNYNQFNLHPS